MKSYKAILLLALAFLLNSVVQAAVPKLISTQGQLRNAGGNPIPDSTFSVTFKIYDASLGGNVLWMETQSVVTKGGLFAVILGSVSPIPDSVFKDTLRWLGTTISPDPEMTPRSQLVSVGYSFKVSSIDGASGGTITSKVSIGASNINTGTDAFVAGSNNRARGGYSVISGGGGPTVADSNSALGYSSAIGGGAGNIVGIFGDFAAISGGGYNYAKEPVSYIGGGAFNVTGEAFATICGGNHNKARGVGSFIGGGGAFDNEADSNSASGNYSVVVGGQRNRAMGDNSTIGGGSHNMTGQSRSAVCGGSLNTAEGPYSVVAGGLSNIAGNPGAVVCGGGVNRARGKFSFVGGGGGSNDGFGLVSDSNLANGDYSIVTGGRQNVANETEATVGGGSQNAAAGIGSTVCGGSQNTASGTRSIVCGGELNSASAFLATVGGGDFNEASGDRSMVPGGSFNTASGWFSFAAGCRAKAVHAGAFVWADSNFIDFTSTADMQFNVRASGGTRIFSNAALTAGVTLASGASAWAAVSDSNLKRNIRVVDGKEMLDKVMQLPIKRWSYKAQDPSIEHIGPMAQDFYPLFKVGDDKKTISTIDPPAIALAAIQELYKKTLEIDALKVKVQKLKELVEGLIAEKTKLSESREARNANR